MAVRTREHVPILTATLSVASLALVFGAVLGAIPADALPHAPAFVAVVPHLNAAISVAAIGTIAVGWRAEHLAPGQGGLGKLVGNQGELSGIELRP